MNFGLGWMDVKNSSSAHPFQTGIPTGFRNFRTFVDMETKINIPNDIKAILTLHVGKNFSETETSSQVQQLLQKRKRYWLMIAVNLFALVFFTYSFFAGITQLNSFVYYALGTVFLMNVLLIFYQRSQISRAIDWLENHGR